MNLSIVPLDTGHIDEVCADIIEQQKTCVSTHAMFLMKFNPEGTPAADKATRECKRYDLFRERLDRADAKHGVLDQATLGHQYSADGFTDEQITDFLKATFFNLSQDALDELPIAVDGEVDWIEKLDEQGVRVSCDFYLSDGTVYVKESVAAMEPIVLFISKK